SPLDGYSTVDDYYPEEGYTSDDNSNNSYSEQYVDEDEEKEQSYSSNQRNYMTAKKLFRNPDERAVGGVASGIAAYFGMATIWMRLFFIIALFVGFGFLLYIILWIVIPEAKTASDKLQMRGDDVNIDSIGKTFKEEADRMSDNFRKTGQQYGKKAEVVVGGFFNLLSQIVQGILKIFGKIFGVILLIVGTFWLVGLVSMLVGSEMVFSITSDGIFSLESSEFFNVIFVSENQFHLAVVGIILSVGLPIVMLIYGGVKLLFNVKTHSGVGVGLFILWVIGLFMCAMVGIKMGTELSQDETIVTKEIISLTDSDFHISASTVDNPGKGILEDNYSVISLDEDSIYQNYVRLYIEESKTDSMELRVIKSSGGKSRKDAVNNAKMISYSYSVTDSSFFLGNYLSVLKEDKIRGQQIKLKLYLPVGKTIYLDKSLKYILYDVDNVTRTRDKKMVNKKWVMLEDGLTCLDCEDLEGVTSVQLDSIKAYKPIIEEINEK
ncbi:MAG: PspC domain-containing protein, partial [Flavobacteriales bacterium]|nr:PspC domain-containing protein [Flavobacteriales bacterium]